MTHHSMLKSWRQNDLHPRNTEVFKDLATEFVERKSHDSSSLANQRLVVTSCHACELSS